MKDFLLILPESTIVLTILVLLVLKMVFFSDQGDKPSTGGIKYLFFFPAVIGIFISLAILFIDKDLYFTSSEQLWKQGVDAFGKAIHIDGVAYLFRVFFHGAGLVGVLCLFSLDKLTEEKKQNAIILVLLLVFAGSLASCSNDLSHLLITAVVFETSLLILVLYGQEKLETIEGGLKQWLQIMVGVLFLGLGIFVLCHSAGGFQLDAAQESIKVLFTESGSRGLSPTFSSDSVGA